MATLSATEIYINDGSSNVQTSLENLFNNINSADGVYQLDENGKIYAEYIGNSDIQGYVGAQQPNKTNLITVAQRIDVIIEQKEITNIVYSGSDYLLDGDIQRYENGVAYVEYGSNPTDSLVSLIYDETKKLVRVDYYLDRSTYITDGSGRDAYITVSYIDGKLDSAIFVET